MYISVTKRIRRDHSYVNTMLNTRAPKDKQCCSTVFMRRTCCSINFMETEKFVYEHLYMLKKLNNINIERIGSKQSESTKSWLPFVVK